MHAKKEKGRLRGGFLNSTYLHDLLSAVLILVFVMAAFTGCSGPSGLDPKAQNLSNQVAAINPADPGALAGLLAASQKIDAGQDDGSLTEADGQKLAKDLSAKFSSWVKQRVDDIDPADPDSLKDFFDLQTVQRLREFDEHCDPATKKYKEDQMKKKFNQWVRNRVDDIDPRDPNALKDFFDLQAIQQTEKYTELATAATHDYKEAQMKEKFNQWVRNRVDDIDPRDPNSLKDFFALQTIQQTEKYEKLATAATHEYKEAQMKQKFNDYIRNLVDGLDPNDPDFLDKLAKLRRIQSTEKYAKFITPAMHAYKEAQLKVKFGQFVRNKVDALNPSAADFPVKLAELTRLQTSDIYDELCPEDVKKYKEGKVQTLLAKPAGSPLVRTTYPRDGQSGVALDQSIVVVFDQSMKPQSLVAAMPALAREFKVTWLDANFLVAFQPVSPLLPETTYTFEISPAATSAGGLALGAGYRFSFTTRAAGNTPQVVRTQPVAGDIFAPTGDPVLITFSEPMEPASVASAITISPETEYGIIWQEDGTVLSLQSFEPLHFNTNYTITIGSGAVSAGGLPLKEASRFSFITGIAAAPGVLGTLPLNQQAGIPRSYPLQIVFARPMDTASVEAALKVSPAFAYTARWLEADFVLLLEIPAPLAANTTYTIQVGTGARSAAGLPLEKGYAFSFSTGD